jgi:hypothetical protein
MERTYTIRYRKGVEQAGGTDKHADGKPDPY